MRSDPLLQEDCPDFHMSMQEVLVEFSATSVMWELLTIQRMVTLMRILNDYQQFVSDPLLQEDYPDFNMSIREVLVALVEFSATSFIWELLTIQRMVTLMRILNDNQQFVSDPLLLEDYQDVHMSIHEGLVELVEFSATSFIWELLMSHRMIILMRILNDHQQFVSDPLLQEDYPDFDMSMQERLLAHACSSLLDANNGGTL